MTNSPTDLLTVRQHVMALTGLTDPADVGIVALPNLVHLID